MPFGLYNTPDAFQPMVDNTFHDLSVNVVILYLNDILIYAENVDKFVVLV